MKIVKKLFVVLMALFCVGLSTVGQSKSVVYAKNTVVNQQKFRYNILPQEEMPIVAYMAMPPANANDSGATSDNPTGMSIHNFLTYKQAGFNILCGLYDKIGFKDADVRKALDLCEMLDMPYIINDPEFAGNTNLGHTGYATIEQYKTSMQSKWYINSKVFGGFAMKDEPSAYDYNAMHNIKEALTQVDAGKIVHTTLFPYGVEEERMGLSRKSNYDELYDDYVRLLMEKVNPNVLVFDKYMFFDNNNIEDISRSYIDSYIKNISTVKKYAEQYNTPFWANVAVFNHLTRANFTYKQMLWTVNLNLAYGAQGIQYYTYWDNYIAYSDMDDWDNNSGAGAVNYTGGKKENYYEIQKINQNIKVVDEVLMTSTHKGVMQFGKQIVPMQYADTIYSYGPLKEVVGGNVFVGCFDHNGKPAYYIMNNSTQGATQTFKANFLTDVNVKVSNIDTNKTYTNTTCIGFNLTAGQAVLLEVL